MVEIYQCLLMVLHWKILVYYQSQISIQLRHNVNVKHFSLFLFDDSKKDTATNTTHSKRLIQLIKEKIY